MSNTRSFHRRFKSSGIGQLFAPGLQGGMRRPHSSKKKNKNKHRIHRIIMLGDEETGKSTICKQLDFIVNGIPDSSFIEEQCWSREVLLSVVSGLENLVQCAKQRGVETSPESGLDHKIYHRLHLLKRQVVSGEMFRKDYDRAFKLFHAIWSDPNLRQMVAQRELGPQHHFSLHKGMSYLCEEMNLERICHEYYLPSIPDYIKSYSRTSSVVTYELQIEDMKIDLVDVGGHASQRHKWKKLYNDDTEELYQVWFVADLSSFNEYGETSSDRHTAPSFADSDHITNAGTEVTLSNTVPKTRLQESLDQFDSIVQKFLIREEKSLVLVLTMYDRFVRKIKKLELNMAEFGFEKEFDKKMASDVDYCTRFIINQFMKRVKRHQSSSTSPGQKEKKIRVYIINPQDRKTVVSLCEAAMELKSIYHMDNRCINAVRQVQKELATGVRPEMGSFVLGLGGSFGSFRQISKDDCDLPSVFSTLANRSKRHSNSNDQATFPVPPHSSQRGSNAHMVYFDDSVIARSPSACRSPVQNFVPTGSFRASFTSMNRTDSVAMNLDDIMGETVCEILSDDEEDDDEEQHEKSSLSTAGRACKLQSDVLQFALETFEAGLDNDVDGLPMPRSASLESCTTSISNNSTGSNINSSSNSTINSNGNTSLNNYPNSNCNNTSLESNGGGHNKYRSRRRQSTNKKSQRLDLAKSFRNIKHIFASRPEEDGTVKRASNRRQEASATSPTSPIGRN